jgi:hypothetical protein
MNAPSRFQAPMRLRAARKGNPLTTLRDSTFRGTARLAASAPAAAAPSQTTPRQAGTAEGFSA